MVSDRLAIETIDLWKRYGDVEALRGLDLQVPAGSICGFLGTKRRRQDDDDQSPARHRARDAR